jgi:hypothetical protein
MSKVTIKVDHIYVCRVKKISINFYLIKNEKNLDFGVIKINFRGKFQC